MVNAEKFRNVFGLYASEVWSMPQTQFLEWLNADAGSATENPNRLTDGTLIVTVDKVEDVARVLVKEDETHRNRLFYWDGTNACTDRIKLCEKNN